MAMLQPVWYMMNAGIKIDIEQKNRFSAEYNNRWHAEQSKLDSIVGRELNVNSQPQVKDWLYHELKLPPRRKRDPKTGQSKLTTDEAALRSLLAFCAEKQAQMKTMRGKARWLRGYLSIMMILQIRAIRKRISSYINAKIDNDFHMRTTISVGGTETGRFTHSKTLWSTGCNLATIPRELRSMFVADEGKELCEFDLNRGESWVYAHLSEDPEMMRIHREGEDFHAHTAAAISTVFNPDRPLTVQEIIDGDKAGDYKMYKVRFIGKKTNHASGYRQGPFQGAESINKDADDTGITVTVGQFKKMLRLWKRKYINMEGKWWPEIEQALNIDRTLSTPYGRVRTFYERWGDELFKEATAYVPQSTSVDYLNVGMLNVYDNIVKPGTWGLQLLHQNHDSILVQYDEGYRDEVIPAVVSHIRHTVEINSYDIIIPVEASYGNNWGELREYKIAA